LTPHYEVLQLCSACNCLVVEPFAAAAAKVAGTLHLSACCKGKGG